MKRSVAEHTVASAEASGVAGAATAAGAGQALRLVRVVTTAPVVAA